MATEVEKEQATTQTYSRGNEVIAVVTLALAILVFLCLVTFNQDDWSFNNNSTEKTQNWLGITGSVIADLLFQTIGLTAYFLPALLVLIAWRLIRAKDFSVSFSRLVGYILFIVSVSSLSALMGFSGGVLGVFFSQIFVSLIGKINAGILLAIFFATAFLLITNLSIAAFFGGFRMAWENFRMRFDERFGKYRLQRAESNEETVLRTDKRLEKQNGNLSEKTPSISLGETLSANLKEKKEAPQEKVSSIFNRLSSPPMPKAEIIPTIPILEEISEPPSEIKESNSNLPKILTEEEKQKFLELRSKVIQLKNKVLDKVESLQNSFTSGVDIDSMDGLVFEHYVAKLLNNRGFHAEVTKGSGDLGVDIIASNYEGKYAIQVKRYNQPVSRRAISDAVAGKNHYNCDLAMVITNNYFTNDAIKLAKSNNCLLVDRDELTRWMGDYTDESKSYNQLLADEIKELQQSIYYWGEEVVFEVSKELIQSFNLKLEGKQYEKYYVSETPKPQDYSYKHHGYSSQNFDNYALPTTEFLTLPPPRVEYKKEEFYGVAKELEDKTKEFNVNGRVMHICQGPVVTTYEFKPDSDMLTLNLLTLSNKLRTALNIESLRIERIPNKPFIGIQILNEKPETTFLLEVVESKKFRESNSLLTIALGKTIDGLNYVCDLAKLSPLFIAGATNSLKTANLDVIINSIFYKAHPDEVKFVMIDFTRKELEIYVDIPHLATPIIKNPYRAIISLKWALSEMEKRYKDLASWGISNIESFNTEVEMRNVYGYFDENGKPYKKLPYIIIIINEFADLVSHKEVEELITRLTQMAQAVGIHLVLTTQQLSQELSRIINKVGNFSKLISYIPAPFDARFLIDQNLTKSLMTRDEMIFFPLNTKQFVRLYEPSLDEREITMIVEHLKAQAIPEYNTTITKTEEEWFDIDDLPGKRDILFIDALRTVVQSNRASTSLLQRHLSIGYGRAAAILDAMVHEGYIGDMDGSTRARPILQKAYDDLQEVKEGREL